MKFCVAFLILFLSLCPRSWAQDSKPLTLPQIDVVGGEKASLFHTAGSADYVTKEQIKARKPISAQDAIKQVTGLHVVESEGFGLFPRIGLRGLNPDMSRKTSLLEDGVPLQLGPYTDPSSYYAPPIERLESVEVFKGSSVLRYGPSTTGGAINFISKAPPSTPRAALTLAGGNRNTLSGMIEAGGTFDSSAISVNWQRLGSDGNRENNRFDVDDVMLKFGTSLSESQYVGAKLTYYNNQAQATYRGLTEQEYQSNHLQNPAQDDFVEVNRIGLDINYEWEINPRSRFKTLLYTNTAHRDWWRQNINNTTLVLEAGNMGRLRAFDVYGLDTRYQRDFSFAGIQNELELGVRFHGEKMTSQEIQGVVSNSRSGTIQTDEVRKARSVASFLQNKFKLSDRLHLTPSLRVESYQQERDILRTNGLDNTQIGNTQNSEVIPGLAISYKMTPNFQLFVGAHRGFAPPRVQDSIHIDGSVSNLEAENSLNLELGGRLLSRQMEWQFTAFQMDFENQIAVASDSGGLGLISSNAGPTLHQGFESSFRLLLLNPVFFDINWTYLPVAKLNGSRLIGGQDRNGNRLTYAPEHVLSLGLDLRQESWGVRTEYMYVSEQFSDFANTEVGSSNGINGLIPSYGLVNLAADIQITEGLQVYLTLKNAMNEKYISSRAPLGIFPGLQRMVLGGVRGSF